MIPSQKYRRYTSERQKPERSSATRRPDDLMADYRQLLAGRVGEAVLQSSLTDARQNVAGARETLIHQLRWLSYSVAFSFSRKSCRLLGRERATLMEEAIGRATIAVYIAVRRLLKPDREGEANIERFVRRVIWSRLRSMNWHDSSDIHVPDSTNSTRAEGEKYHDLRRAYPSALPYTHERDCEKFALERTGSAAVREGQDGSPYTHPVRGQGSLTAEAHLVWKELLGSFDEIDIRILCLRYAEYTLPEIVDCMSLTVGKVKYRLTKMRKACQKRGFTPGELRASLPKLPDMLHQALNSETAPNAGVTLAVELDSQANPRDTWASQSV